MCLLGTFSPYMVVHEYVRRQDRQGHPVRGRRARRLRRAHRLGFGDAHGARSSPGESVAIIGVGGVGMSALQGAVASRGAPVFAIDPVPFKREQALKFGATHAFASAEAAIEPIMELTCGLMARRRSSRSGEMNGEYVEEALRSPPRPARCVVTAMGHMADMDVKLNLVPASRCCRRTCKGNIFGGGNARVEIPNLLAMYKSGQLNLDDMITRTYTLERSTTGYQDMLDGKNIRGVIRYTEADW